MKNNYTEEKVLLDRKGVDHISESIRIWLKRCGVGIPDSSLAVAALLGIVTDFISTGTRVGIIHCEMVIQADRLNMLDRKILSADN